MRDLLIRSVLILFCVAIVLVGVALGVNNSRSKNIQTAIAEFEQTYNSLKTEEERSAAKEKLSNVLRDNRLIPITFSAVRGNENYEVYIEELDLSDNEKMRTERWK